MALKTFVKVGSISNLSDARYCAGMGVEMLGFQVCPEQDGFVEPKLFQEIRGWVTGPKVVAEVYGTIPDLIELVSNYAPDYLETNYENYLALRDKTELPFIVAVNKSEFSIVGSDKNVLYRLIDLPTMKALSEGDAIGQLLVRVKSVDELNEALTQNKAMGVCVKGSAEMRPGFKDYADLADILESLDSD